MKLRIIIVSLACVFAFVIAGQASPGGAVKIAGKWLAKADTPNGPVDLVFDIQQEGDRLTGTAVVFETTTPINSLKFDDGKFSGEITVMGGNYRLAATLAGGKMTGTWEEVAGEYRGTWTAEQATVAPVSAIVGSWDITAAMPEGDAAYLLELNQEGDALTGTIGGEMGAAPLTALSYKDGTLHFEVDGGGNLYIVDGALEGETLKGRWAISGGGESGTWSGKRKGGAPGAASPAQANLGGTWDGSADTADGTMTFEMQLQQNGSALAGQIPTPEGTVTLQKVSFTGGKLVFEVDYMGGTYRIEATLEGDSLDGKWSAVDGSDSGRFAARKKTL